MNSYTVKQISAMLNTNEETVRRWIRSGKLAATLTSNKTGHVISAEALNRFLRKTPKYASLVGTSVAMSPLAISVLIGSLLGGLLAITDKGKKVTPQDVRKFLEKNIASHEKKLAQKQVQLQRLQEEIAKEEEQIEKYQYALGNLDLNIIADQVNATKSE